MRAVWEEVYELTDLPPDCLFGSLRGLSHKMFELGEDLLDWVEIWAVWRQEEQPCAGSADSFAGGLGLVA